jgi:hypothetical protein
MRHDIPDDLAGLIERHGSLRQAAAATGIPFSTLQYRRAQQLATNSVPVAGPDELEYPDIPSSELSPAQLIDQAAKRFASRQASRDARRWFEIKVKSNAPIGVVIVGDPHVDNPGANWPLLREHIRILETTPGLYAIGGNDITDNWVGRLARLYDDSDMTKKAAWKLAIYLLKETKIKWLAHVLGNHDLWNDGATIIKTGAQAMIPVEEWQARFQLRFSNGSTTRFHMAHDFPGQSQWNQLHGAQKMALWGEQADVYASAHKHSWALAQSEHPHTGNTYWLTRSRGYKFIDSYADQLGFGNQRYGASITAVIDPGADGPKRVTCFAELDEAAEFLTWKRSRA